MSAATFSPGDRVQDRPGTSDRFEGPGTVASVSEPQPGHQFVAVRHDNTTVTSWWADELEPADDPQLGQSRVTCSARACNGAHIVGDHPTTEAWMDRHAATVAHGTRWPACFRVNYPGSTLPGVAYRDSRAADELEAVSPDDVPAGTSVGEVTTEVVPDGGATWWECPRPGCDTVIGEAGPVDPDDDYDPVREHVEGHERDEQTLFRDVPENPTIDEAWGSIPAMRLWGLVREVPELFDALAAVARAIPPADGAAMLRRVADVLDGGTE